jgi:RNA 2',3'-cyclic 3'-phosphodiesterase
MRTFLAVPVLPPALATFQALRERLVAGVGKVRWAPAETPHITLHFFGALDDDAAAIALAALRPALAEHTPITMRLRGLGAFPSNHRPRVLWCGVDGEVDALSAVAHSCAVALGSAGFAVGDRPWRAHCTVGRPREPWPAESLQAWRAAAAEEPCTPAFTAGLAVLYESVRGPAGGVRHVPRVTLPFGVGRAQERVGGNGVVESDHRF